MTWEGWRQCAVVAAGMRRREAIRSMAYDPYDYFDLGDFDQKGGMKTLYGNRAELEALIAKVHEHGIGDVCGYGDQSQLRRR